MDVKIHNSLTRSKEVLKDKIVRMYSCGVTVYDKCHIGHARSLYVFEVIRRYLKYRGYQVRFVRNITDIDDKIIHKARELNKDWIELVRENIDGYYADLDRLGLEKADVEPRATDQENLDEMIVYIKGMIEQGFAYESRGGVYFNVRKYAEKFPYGELSGQSIEQMQEAVRIDKDEQKKDPLDFALWKRSKEGEPFWPSPWGNGRPGWHIECSCMSRKHLECDTLDIHAGGRDLIFPHHENEIAQAQAFNGKKFAQMWIHHGLLTINKQKMAKSLGNFITIEDAEKDYGADALKMFFLSSHYRSSIDFSEEKIFEAKENIKSFQRLFKELEKIKVIDNNAGADVPQAGQEFAALAGERFDAAMDDDFNTPQALAALFVLVKETNQYIASQPDAKSLKSLAKKVRGVLNPRLDILGLSIQAEQGGDLSEEIRALIEERVQARKKKDFKRSDELRDQLKNFGIAVKDTKDGQEWEKI